MDFLRRIFNGRIDKPRQAADQRSDPPRAPLRAAQQSRQTRVSSLRAGSGSLAPNHARSNSPQQDCSPGSGVATVPDVRIKQENEEDGSLSMAAPRYNDPGIVAQHHQLDGSHNEMQTGDPSNGAASPEYSVKKEPSQGDSPSADYSMSNADEMGSDEEYTNEEDDDDQHVEEEESSGGHPNAAISFDSNVPIPSIEENDREGTKDEEGSEGTDEEEDGEEQDDDEEADGPDDEDEQYPREKTPIYLHGMTHMTNRTPEGEPADGIGKEYRDIGDEDFEKELKGEMERNLLIDNHDLRCWLHHKRATAGIETWPSEACRLYKLLFLRGLYPMFPKGFTWDFSLDSVPSGLYAPFSPDPNEAKCLLKPEFCAPARAANQVRSLFKLHGFVASLRQQLDNAYLVGRISAVIKREIEVYVRWAEMDIRFYKRRDYISPVFILRYKTPREVTTGRSIVEQCQRLVEKYRSGYASRNIQAGSYPRCVYIFVIVQHVVLVMVADTERLVGEPYPLAELDLSQRSHFLDYTLAISTTVLLAREALVAHRSSLPEIEWETDDPDL